MAEYIRRAEALDEPPTEEFDAFKIAVDW